jgi:hypothetical protein
MKMLTDNLVYPPQADPRPTRFSLLTSHFSLPRLCTHKLKMSNEPNLHNFFTISLHFLTSPSSGQGNPNESRRLLNMPCKPNFQTPRLTVTLDMIRTNNENCPKKHKKSKPIPNPIQSQSKLDPNPIQTLSKPNQTQFRVTFFFSHFTFFYGAWPFSNAEPMHYFGKCGGFAIILLQYRPAGYRV